MPDPFLLPELPPTPSGALTVLVGCGTSRTGPKPHKHPLTIDADWSVATPHDIELERIALAMGGYLSCIDLVDRVVPALRELLQRRARRTAPKLVRNDDGRWVLCGPPQACGCDSFGFADVAEAVEHWRGVQHVACERGINARALARLVDEILDAYDTTFALPPTDRLANEAVRERRGVEYLWDAGLHPSMLTTIHRAVWPGGPPLPVWFYLGAMSRRPDLDWIASTLRTVPDEDIAVWLCWTGADLDRVHPEARTGWLQAGVPRVAVAALADGSYTPIDVLQLSHATGRSIPAAAITLAAWHRAGCHPTPEDIALLDELGVDRWYEPVKAAVDWLCARTPRRDGPSRTAVALVLAVCGTRAGALKAFALDVYDPRGAARVMGIPIDRELTPQ